jgi:hypothetical protein
MAKRKSVNTKNSVSRSRKTAKRRKAKHARLKAQNDTRVKNGSRYAK